MRDIIYLLWLGFFSMAILIKAQKAHSQELASRILNFTHILPGIRFKSAFPLTAPLDHVTEAGCAAYCSRSKYCKSFNYCGHRLCILLWFDIHNVDPYSELVSDQNCIYVGMERETHPNCKDNGTVQDIQDDIYPGICQINLASVSFLFQFLVENNRHIKRIWWSIKEPRSSDL